MPIGMNMSLNTFRSNHLNAFMIFHKNENVASSVKF